MLVQSDKSLGGKGDNQADVFNQVKAMAPMFTHLDISRFSEGSGKDLPNRAAMALNEAVLVEKGVMVGVGKAFIGGGCCVHLSIEYTPTNPASTLPAIVVVMVQDSENTMLVWAKLATASEGYQIKEGIVTTKPGAHLTVLAVNMTARVRWCEVFSC